MRTVLLLLFAMSVLSIRANGGEREGERLATKTIRVVDAETGEPIIGATIQFSCMAEAQYTDPDGLVQIPQDVDRDCDISISYISYDELAIDLAQVSLNQEIALKSR